MLKYAYEMNLIEHPIRYCKAFDRPSSTLMRKSRRAAVLANGKRLFEAREVRSLINKAQDLLRAQILLGIKGGFGNTDCAYLPISTVDWERSEAKGSVDTPLHPILVQASVGSSALAGLPSQPRNEERHARLVVQVGLPETLRQFLLLPPRDEHEMDEGEDGQDPERRKAGDAEPARKEERREP